MKINGTGKLELIKTYASQMQRESAAARDKAVAPVQADMLVLSREALKIQSLKSKLDNISAVREELVALFRQKLADGTYRPDPYRIADGIIREWQADKSGGGVNE